MKCGECRNTTAQDIAFPNSVYCKRFLLHYDKNDDATKCNSFVPKRKTNADRIRAMTDEELAEMHVGVGCPPGTDLNELCFDENGEELLCTPTRCRECWFNWLRKEAEHG